MTRLQHMTVNGRSDYLKKAKLVAELLPPIATTMSQSGNVEQYWGPVLEASFIINYLLSEIEGAK